MALSVPCKRTFLSIIALSALLCGWPLPWVTGVDARPPAEPRELSPSPDEEDIVGDVDGTQPAPQKALQDTIWIADWSFDTGSPCSGAGWTHVDNHILNDGVVHWHMESRFAGQGGIVGTAAAVGYHGNVCCSLADGYDNGWYQAIRLQYTGDATLSFDYLLDAEQGFDFLQVETDSACASFARVDYYLRPSLNAAMYRTVAREVIGGPVTSGSVTDLALSSYGGGSHCVYIAFISDGGISPCDGNQPTILGEGAVIDDIVLVDASGTRSENFEDGDLDIGTFMNIADSVPFGTWARLYRHITDNDACTENTTCAWLWSDHTTPTRALDPSLAFGPGGFVVRNWLDDIIMSPWVSLASTPTATGTVLQFRRFPGNFFSNSRIVQNWSVRGRRNVEGQACTSAWGHASQWNSLSFFGWQTLRLDMTANFDPAAEAIQIRHRTSDWQWIAGATPPAPFITGPGPYIDRTRIGRLFFTGPRFNEGIDSRSQAQDCFPSEIDPTVTPAGQHFRPTTDRIGTCAFSEGTELAISNLSPRLITGDSIHVSVDGIRPGGAVVTSVTWSGAIVYGPHVGKAPSPYTLGAGGFFTFDADSVRAGSGSALANRYYVDLDDFYFRGGDGLVYFWAATDNGGGFSSDPAGLSGPPASVAAAQGATNGLFQVDFLPAIDWDPAYLAAIAADDYGDIEPTPAQVDNSTQRNALLYVQNINARRMSGDVNRTSFMYSLDRLGYRDAYDVYDHQGMGNTNNQLGGRATVEQCQGYYLIVYDNGNGSVGRPLLPDGVYRDSQKIDQAGWFRRWLEQVPGSEAGSATLWLIGSNMIEEKPTNALVVTDMGVNLNAPKQPILNPEVVGVDSIAFVRPGGAMVPMEFSAAPYVVSGICSVLQHYDGLGGSGTAVVTHRYRNVMEGTFGEGALVMNSNPAGRWNTIVQSHPWFHIQHVTGPGAQPPVSPQPGEILLQTVLDAVLPEGLGGGTTHTDLPGLPSRTALYPNCPNPFNPMTTLRFDLARSGHVRLRLYDVAGRQVRTLVDGEMRAARDRTAIWDGRDDAGRVAPSGVYLSVLEADGLRSSRKLILLR